MEIRAIAVLSGPDSGRIVDLRELPGATIGRAAELRIDDQRLEVVHARIDRSSGALTPLGGSVLTTVGGDHLLGATALRLVSESPRSERRTGRVIARPIRAQQPIVEPTPPVVLDDQSAPAAAPRSVGTGSLIGAAVGIGGSTAFALVTGNAMFLLIGSIGALTAVATWTVDLVRSQRHRRRERSVAAERRVDEINKMHSDHQRRVLALRHVWPIDLVAAAKSPRVWERRRDHADFLRVVIATQRDTHPAVEHNAPGVPDVPFSIDLASVGVVAVIAPPSISTSILRSIVSQLAVAVGPADLIIDPQHAELLQVFRHLPHHQGGGLDDRHRLIVGFNPAELSDPASPARRALDSAAPATLIVGIAPGDPIPASVDAIVEVDADWRARWTPDTSRPKESRSLVAAVGASVNTATRVAAELKGLIDPELPPSSQMLPSRVDLGSLLGGSEVDAKGDDALEMILGVGDRGPIVVDLVRDGPHALVAGTTGSGKSELLRAMVVSAADRHAPDTLNIALIDFKGGAAFDSLASLPHVVGTLTDLDGYAANRALTGLTAELRRREEMLRDQSGASRRIPRLLIVIDEFAELVAADPNASRAMLGIARRGRSLGVHLVIATQRPSGVVNDEVRANTDLRVCLRVNSTADSIDVIADPAAAGIDRRIPGRAVLAVAGRGIEYFQTALVTGAEIERLRSRRPRHRLLRPWQDPLPADLPPIADAADFGIVDRPETQRFESLRWEPEEGSLIISGDPSTGRTTALRTVLFGTRHPTHLVTARTGEAIASDAEHVGDAIRADDGERLRRLLRQLHREISWRRDGSPRDRLVLAIDGIDTVVSEFERLGDEDSIDLLRGVINDGGPLGLPTVATTRSLRRLDDLACTHWLLHRADIGSAQHLGAPTALLPPRIPGRILRLPDPAQAQIRRPPSQFRTQGVSPPAPVRALPRRTGRLDPVGARVERGLRLELGIDADDLAPVDITLTGGRHLLVIGGPGSGRTTALDWIGESWRSITGEPPARIRHSLDELPEASTGLVLIDDALTVDGGVSADRIRHQPGIVIVAATDGDGLRGSWGHWLGDVRRWRTGLVMASGGALDGDLLGATLPSRTPIAGRPGLAWWVADGRARLLQVHAGPEDPSMALHPGPVTTDDMLAR
jgi:S-DNA-T family DNA segregation ATPase FtsK/SpoIIIE